MSVPWFSVFVRWAILSFVSRATPVPLIIDADFGGPIDDTFAIAYALKEQELYDTFDIRLLNMAGRNTTARATLLAKYLQVSGYQDAVDIGIGIEGACGNFFSIGCVGPAWPYNGNFTLDDYNGTVYNDGISRMIELIEDEATLTSPMYIITLGAMTNVEYIFDDTGLNRTDLKPYVRMFTMSGSLFSNTEPFGKFAEFNIGDDIPAAVHVYNEGVDYFSTLCAATWDTGYYFQIEGNEYQMLLDIADEDELINQLIYMYDIWYDNGGSYFDSGRIFHPNNASASMYDLEIVVMAALVAKMGADEQDKSCINITTYMDVDTKYVLLNDSGHVIINNNENDNYTMVDFAVNWTMPNGIINISQYVTSILIGQNEQESTTTTGTETTDQETTMTTTDNEQDGDSDNANVNFAISGSSLVILFAIKLAIC